MARIRVLTALKIKQNLKPGMCADGPGTVLEGPRWQLQELDFPVSHRRQAAGHGAWPGSYRVACRGSREGGRLQGRLKGLDPLDERHKEQQATIIEATEAITFEKCAETYIATHKAGWKNGKHADQWTATLQTYIYPGARHEDGPNPNERARSAASLLDRQRIWMERCGR
ncbi:phage integrase central domain-containing protein [Bradyrhizobium zhanjiangense]|uniref:phage integrase central domain-containing protein n=1 Tax=Bradyrhizobium zhanjiangense TaxID=1325107 RepID=UPI001FE11D6E|nr:hypothetical protein [Bradyrhizobium zhanjiangense]